MNDQFSIEHAPPLGVCATLACVWEVTAPKPGNVYRGADFEDTSYADFITSAVVVGPILAQTAALGVGPTVLAAVRATQRAVGTNTNLGTLLLLAPLAAVESEQSYRHSLATVLDSLNDEDTSTIYQAIREARAGGLGQVPQADVHRQDTSGFTLREAMRLASSHDQIAAQYTNGFHDVLDSSAPWIFEGIGRGWTLAAAVVHTYLRLLSVHPDSLVARKCGQQVAEEVSLRSREVLALGDPGDPKYEQGLEELDFWLRADGHRRNPGTTADLIAAGLFVLLRQGAVHWPLRFYGDANMQQGNMGQIGD